MTWQEFKDEVERQLRNLDLNERVEIRYIDVSFYGLRGIEDYGSNVEVSEDDDGTITIER